MDLAPQLNHPRATEFLAPLRALIVDSAELASQAFACQLEHNPCPSVMLDCLFESLPELQ
jgi:hypothetical protein